MAAPLPITGVKPNIDFRDPRTLTPLVKQGGLCQLEDLGQISNLVPTIRNLVSRYQGSPNAVPIGTEELLDALLEKANAARLKKQLSGGSDLYRDEAILVSDLLWVELTKYAATRKGRQIHPDLTYGCSRPK